MQKQIEELLNALKSKLDDMSALEFRTAKTIISTISIKIKLNSISKQHAIEKRESKDRFHPIRPYRGEIYHVLLSQDNVGKELNGPHLCVIISNQKKNNYSEKVNVVPIEGDGNRIDRMNHVQVTNKDMEDGLLRKDPSRIIGGDIMTIDKSRLDIKIGKLSTNKQAELDRMLKNQLKL